MYFIFNIWFLIFNFMILTPHILAGAAIGSKFSSPEIVAVLSILAHFAMDVIPHYEYRIDAMKNARGKINKQCLANILKIGADFLIGASLATLFIWPSPQKYMMIAGAAGALLPDLLLFLHYQNRNLPIVRQIAAFHQRIHWFKKIARPNFLGLATQIAVTTLAIMLLSL